ncbi:MAG: flagellar filament capping protein FliD [Spirochaetaceae bacterium]|nr:flagellar filament capping protein FliD [Spirochaetaceae bacterium]
MSDITIPGVTSKVNSDKIIENLMKIERIPLERLEEKNKLSKKQKQVWQILNRKITLVRDSARKLYSFQNPFDDKRAISSDDSVLTATATRGASVGNKSIKVIEIASADRFSSKPIPKNEQVDPGTYNFFVGEKKISFNFRGGSVRDFADMINRNGKDDLKATIVNYDKDNIYFVVESKLTGSSNKLSFEGKSADFALQTGIMARSQSSNRAINISNENIKEWTAPIDKEAYTIDGNSLTLKSGKELKIDINPQIVTNTSNSENMILEFNIVVKNLLEKDIPVHTAPAGPTLPEPGKATFDNIVIQNNPFGVPVSAWQPPAIPEKITDMSVVFLGAGNKTERLSDLQDNEETQRIQIPLNQIANPFSSINIRNRNTSKEITISNIRIYNPEERGDIVPSNPASKASDAIVEIDGIRVRRSSNIIDDLLPEVTLNLRAPGSRNIDIRVEPDLETIKENIIAFVGNYNDLVAELNILSRNNEEIVNEITYLSEEERKSAMERLGILQTESSITQIRDRLQRIMSAPHRWNEDNFLTLLSQIGISTNSGTAGGAGISRLRGYLEIDEKKLDAEIEKNASSIKNLFGFDKGSNMVIDSGAAFEVDNYLRAYNETAGIISLKISTIDRDISKTDTEITNYNKKLARIEQDLKKKYGAMEGALQELEKTSSSLQNLSPNNNSR